MEKCELQVGSFFIPFVELTSKYVYIVVYNHTRIFCPSCGMWYSSAGSHYFCSTIPVKYKGILYPSISARLVLYNTVHKGTSKHQKQMKSTHFVLHVSPSIFGFLLAHYTQQPFKNEVGYICFKNTQCLWRNVNHLFVSFGFWFQPKTIFISS